ncbi:MAG: FkbM family methyltransferase [Verrucomicrobiota bacterium]
MSDLALKLLRQFAPLPGQLRIADALFGKELAQKGVKTIQTYSGIEWKLDLDNPTHRWLVYGHYQGPALYAWAKKNLPGEPCVVLSGANIGQMIAEFHPLVHNGMIHAFEPDPHAHEWLSHCLHLNPDLPVRLSRQGLGQETKTQKFVSGQWGHTHGSQSFISDEGDLEISVTPLDQYFAEYSQDIDLWILDIEGYEESALKGAEKLIESGRIRHIWMELPGGDETEQNIQFMQQRGYTSRLLRWNGSFSTRPIPDHHIDALFIRDAA